MSTILKITALTLLLAVFITAIQVVLTRHHSRSTFVELQNLQQQRDALHVEWGQLQLEQITWAQHNRIETIAREQLQMRIPTATDIIYTPTVESKP